MGDKNRWKPCVYSVITLTLVEPPTLSGPMVTTAFFDTRVQGVPSTSETLLQIGGTVRQSAAANAPAVAGAWVDLRTVANVRRQLVRADANGRFLLVQVAPGAYQLRVSAPDLGSVVAMIDVPSSSGSYDMHF